jgi:hypothetical protein
MKLADLERHLRRQGCVLRRQESQYEHGMVVRGRALAERHRWVAARPVAVQLEVKSYG